MKELDLIIDDLKEYLSNKKKQIKEKSITDSYIQGAVINREKEIALLEHATKLIQNHPTLKQQIITNFQTDADEVKRRIDEIDV